MVSHAATMAMQARAGTAGQVRRNKKNTYLRIEVEISLDESENPFPQGLDRM